MAPANCAQHKFPCTQERQNNQASCLQALDQDTRDSDQDKFVYEV